ncbi:ribokinase [Cumulibacter manganitolerans]|uniref:ribokinase n=1 Tax=Cumulibacter manganitolerans TaxID=1884992 RepID=UPI001296DDD3|nr:ribokinase [Cumulibacter manganitolerans]
MSVVVLGSANLDVVIDLDRIPGPGETVLTDRSSLGRGGKGNNQAVAAARAGAPTRFLGAVGADESGELLLGGLREAGIDTSLVRRCDDITSGTAYVMVDRHGENAIVVVAGANARLVELTPDEVDALRSAKVLLMQLETPMQTVVAAARTTRAAGGYVMLNAAPYARLPDALVEAIDLLIVNEHEAALAAGSDGSPIELAERITERIPAVLITLGAAGSLLVRRGHEPIRVTAPQVDAVDTTAAGDTFAGAYAAAKVAGLDEPACLQLASSASALAVQRPGAVSSIPERAEIDAALREFYPR